MGPNRRLARNLLSESRAYGYTLSVWGGGGLLLSRVGTPSALEVFAYVGGGVAAFGVLALGVFGHLSIVPDEDRKTRATPLVHVVATLGNLLISYLLLFVFHGGAAYLIIGVQTTFTYNVLLLFEGHVAEWAS
ncbi:hypothetical protein [Haladaptatus caseinilyticus]|uniref:hypothetical protein n=1 Tax=Haladaptatus caseinilyticus TaxID=2993314 RepID=UPI00224A66E7|nr:hypothetical protein [Haladaptatus caseinilyticus]